MRGLSALLGLVALVAFLAGGCSSSSGTSGETAGALAVTLDLGGGVMVDEVRYAISRDGINELDGTINTIAPGSTASIEVFGLAPGDGYLVTLSATSVDGAVSCSGSAPFEVQTDTVTAVEVYLNCKHEPELGGVRVDGNFNFCAELAKVIVSPLQTSVGNDIELSAGSWDAEDDVVDYSWTATGGSIEDPSMPETRFTCTDLGTYSIVISVSDHLECVDEWTVSVACVEGNAECLSDADCLGVFPLPTCRVPTQCSAGTCERGALLAEGTPCLRGGECTQTGGCRLPQCMTDSDCEVRVDPNECREGPTCVLDPLDPKFSYCALGDPLSAGTPCSADTCDGLGECGGGGNPIKSQVVRVACKNNITVDPSYLPSVLTVRPPTEWKADPTETDTWGIGGEAVFDKEFLDAAQAVIPGGVTLATLIDLKWTVQVRSGGQMEDVPLSPTFPYSCSVDRTVLCNPLNDLPDGGGNSDCVPVGQRNSCERFVPLPTSTDCAPGGLCRTAGAAPTAQCEANGFCISDQLRIPLEEQEVAVTPDAAGANITFGWHEFPNRGLHADGTYILPTAAIFKPAGPIGFRAGVGPLGTALECMLGGDRGWTELGPYPVRDGDLLQYFVP